MGRPAGNAYTLALVATGLWIIAGALLTIGFWPSLKVAMGEGAGGTLVFVGFIALLAAPALMFFFMASLSSRSQHLHTIAQSMAQVAMRFSDPETAASDSMVTVGQAIARSMAAMGDGIERALARAGGLET